MSTAMPDELLATFRALAEIVYSGDSYDSVYDGVCEAAVTLIDGCDHASMMLRQRGRISTVAASDDVARRIDDMEKELDEGPCLDAIDEDSPDQHICSDLTAGGSQWAELARRILDETEVRGMAGFRMRQDGLRVGALNVFSDTPGALTERSLEQAAMLTAFASVTLTAVSHGEEASTLRRGLQSNREIGKAVGLLMAMHSIDDERAFEMLAKVSQEMNVKVVEVAAQVIAHHRQPEPKSAQ